MDEMSRHGDGEGMSALHFPMAFCGRWWLGGREVCEVLPAAF